MTDEKNSSQIRKKYDITATFTDVKKKIHDLNDCHCILAQTFEILALGIVKTKNENKP